jgi:hypothetical protein
VAALEVQLADRGGAEREVAGVGGGEADPAGADHAQDVAVREERGVAAVLERPGDGPVGALAGLLGRLALGGTVLPQPPAGTALADLVGRQPLVGAVVVLAQVGVELRAVAEAGQLGGLARAAQRAAEHDPELVAGEPVAQQPGDPAALGREREVGDARVPARHAPLGRAVADEDDHSIRR